MAAKSSLTLSRTLIEQGHWKAGSIESQRYREESRILVGVIFARGFSRVVQHHSTQRQKLKEHKRKSMVTATRLVDVVRSHAHALSDTSKRRDVRGCTHASRGNAKRFETRYWLDVLGVQSVMSYLTSDLWLTAGSPYEYVPNLLSRRPANFFLRGTAILKGFVDFGNGPCNETCCGLPMPSTVQNGDTTGHVCAFTSLDNVSILESYYPAPTNQTGPGGGPGPGPIVTVLTVWEELESLVFNSRESAGLTSTATARSTLGILQVALPV